MKWVQMCGRKSELKLKINRTDDEIKELFFGFDLSKEDEK